LETVRGQVALTEFDALPNGADEIDAQGLGPILDGLELKCRRFAADLIHAQRVGAGRHAQAERPVFFGLGANPGSGHNDIGETAGLAFDRHTT